MVQTKHALYVDVFCKDLAINAAVFCQWILLIFSYVSTCTMMVDFFLLNVTILIGLESTSTTTYFVYVCIGFVLAIYFFMVGKISINFKSNIWRKI
jgi:hypothetical protein